MAHTSDAGVFLPPVFPLSNMPVSIDPENYQPKKGILTRYSKKLLEQGSKFYSRVGIHGDVVDTPEPEQPKKRRKKPEYRSVDDPWET